MKTALQIGWLFPDTLYLHGERGNILALKRVAQAMGLALEVHKIHLEEDFNPLDYDILYCPAGELCRAEAVLATLRPIKEDLDAFVRAGRVLLVTGTSVAFFGKKIKYASGNVIDALGLIDINTYENEAVYGDDILMLTRYNDRPMEIAGCQIQMCDFRTDKENPFGMLEYGYGDNGKTAREGVLKENSLFTATLGPLLALNPWLAQEILTVAAHNKGLEIQTEAEDYALEKKSLQAKKNYIKNKKTDLTNCQNLI